MIFGSIGCGNFPIFPIIVQEGVEWGMVSLIKLGNSWQRRV